MNDNTASISNGEGPIHIGSDGVSRRTIVRGAAWTIPVIAAAAAVPLAAASGCTGGGSMTAPAPTGTQAPAMNSTFTVPAGVTQLTFEVAGAAGGTSTFTDDGHTLVGSGGAGALVTGVLLVTPGQVLSLIVGQGGMGFHNTVSGPPSPGYVGGGGYGSGGSTVFGGGGSAMENYAGGSGGGGSAILLGSTPLIVAGGGGGSGAWNGRDITSSPGIGYPRQDGGNGSGTTGGSGNNSQFATGFFGTRGWTVYGGGGASGAAGGAGGALGSGDGEHWAGSAGAAFGPGGGNGANGVSTTGTARPLVSGAGGGGYAGGGSGGVVRSNGVGTSQWNIAGAAGGAGSSYLDSSATGTYGSAANAPQRYEVRNPGWIRLSWTC
ncbi:hypothetical protein J2Y69_003481 [Microbacterium resistens]|uniref:Glycine rich protein n=1 Tax=Microbacterium resistens TaxID=156977 RepID=A0ABU1SGX3_9MICO|nr:hypothetical protein [Microbacterium resistens]MDR6868855.1 hypothetical protein [Microbacterium resistens]